MPEVCPRAHFWRALPDSRRFRKRGTRRLLSPAVAPGRAGQKVFRGFRGGESGDRHRFYGL